MRALRRGHAARARVWGPAAASVAVTVAPGELYVEAEDDVVTTAEGVTVTTCPLITVDVSAVPDGCPGG